MILNNNVMVVLCISFLVTSIAPAFASPSFDVGQDHVGQNCKIKGATVVVSVTENVLDANDSGVAGNTWAIDNFSRTIKVVREQDGTFCALLFYHGQFNTVGGSSPADVASNSDIKGIFTGIIKTKSFNATLSPTVPTTGSIGTHDYKCNSSSSCPGYVSWQNLFFTNVSGIDSSWFRFVYNGDVHGIWRDFSTGSSGDIK